jgi:hypothetical protein
MDRNALALLQKETQMKTSPRTARFLSEAMNILTSLSDVMNGIAGIQILCILLTAIYSPAWLTRPGYYLATAFLIAPALAFWVLKNAFSRITGIPIPEPTSPFGSPIMEFDLTIPAAYKQRDYDPRAETRNNRWLESGKTYKVQIVPILTEITVEGCMQYLFDKNAILIGKAGLRLMQRYYRYTLPIDRNIISFDQNRRYERYHSSMDCISAYPVYPDFSAWEYRLAVSSISDKVFPIEKQEEYYPRETMHMTANPCLLYFSKD